MIHTEIKKNKSSPVILLALILLGLILRLYGLGDKAVWYDEADSIANAEKDLAFVNAGAFQYKPVYFMLLKLWMNLFGGGELINRFLSVIFGVLTVFLIYKTGKMLFNDKVGLISAFILAISSFHIYHSQQIRQHSFLTFLTLLSFFFFLKLITTPSYIYLIYNALVNIIILGTHPYGLSVIVAQNLFFLFRIKDKALKTKWALSQLAVLCCVLWFFVPNRALISEKIWWIAKPNFGSLIETFETFSFGGWSYGIGDFKIDTELLRIPKYLLVIYAVLFIFGLIPYKNNAVNFSNSLDVNDRIFLLISWLFVPIGLAFLWPVIHYRSVYAIKHLIIVSPAYYILLARGIYQLKRSWIQVPIVLVILFLSAFSWRVMYGNDLHPHWEEAADYVRANVQKGDIIVVSTLKEIMPFMYHFRNERKGALHDIVMYGRLEQGEYRETFSEGENIIVGITENTEKEREYDMEVVLTDFKKKIIDQDFFKENRNIWILMSAWTAEPKRISEIIQTYLQKYGFSKKEEEYYLGIGVYCYSRIYL